MRRVVTSECKNCQGLVNSEINPKEDKVLSESLLEGLVD